MACGSHAVTERVAGGVRDTAKRGWPVVWPRSGHFFGGAKRFGGDAALDDLDERSIPLDPILDERDVSAVFEVGKRGIREQPSGLFGPLGVPDGIVAPGEDCDRMLDG